MKRRRFKANQLGEGIPKELTLALCNAASDLRKQKIPFIVIGGLAMTRVFPVYPTEDVDFAVSDEMLVPDWISGTKRRSKHVFEDESGVIIDIVTPSHVKMPPMIFEYLIASAEEETVCGISMLFAAKLALFAIKLSSDRTKDKAHLLWMMRHGFVPSEIDLLGAGVGRDRMTLLRALIGELKTEEQAEEEMGW